MKTSDFNYHLLPTQIAQFPKQPRDHSKLLICNAQGRLGAFSSPFSFSHQIFHEIEEKLNNNYLIIFNNARVLPVRLLGRRMKGPQEVQDGGKVEALLLRKVNETDWIALLQLSAQVKPGMMLFFEPDLTAEILSTPQERLQNEGEVRLRFIEHLEDWLEKYGHIPLPHYLNRSAEHHDFTTYQTVYASEPGSAAAPTAGFHFTQELLNRIQNKGIESAFLTLNIGIGTFRPIKAELIKDHQMHAESFTISESFAERYWQAKAAKKRILAVGTTVIRALESWVSPEWAGDQCGKAGTFHTRIFIKPGFQFQAADDLLTNFHQPKSSLLVLVGSAMGVEQMQKAYQAALDHNYRFLSYGDSMWIRGH